MQSKVLDTSRRNPSRRRASLRDLAAKSRPMSAGKPETRAARFSKDGLMTRLLRAVVPPAWSQPRRSVILMQIEDDSRSLGVKLGVLVLLILLAVVLEGLV